MHLIRPVIVGIGMLAYGCASDPGAVGASGGSQTKAVAPPSTLVGRTVRVYFRRLDDIPFTEMSDHSYQESQKLDYLRGIVREVVPGWIELSFADEKPEPGAWIPTASIAVIRADTDGAPTATSRP